jgi:hypothetical protein
MSVDRHIGPDVPFHRYGHCSYDPSMSGKYECASLATTHLLVVTGSGVETSTFTCDVHLPLAERLLTPTDRHPVAYDCVKPPPVMWMRSTAERTGWCFTDEDHAESAAAHTGADLNRMTEGATA